MKMDSTLIPQIKHGIMDEDEDSLGSFTSSSSSSSSSELTEDTASSETSSSSSSSASSSPENPCKGPLFELSSLKEQLPFKRGLSKFYEGKSQSFTSISAVRRLEDLVKPERPLKRLKMSRSCGGGLDSQRTSSRGLRYCSSSSKRTIMKKSSSSSISGGRRRNCFLLLGSKPPLYPQRPSNLSDQALWFA